MERLRKMRGVILTLLIEGVLVGGVIVLLAHFGKLEIAAWTFLGLLVALALFVVWIISQAGKMKH